METEEITPAERILLNTRNYNIPDFAIHTPKSMILRTDNPKNDFWFSKYDK